MFCCNYIPWNAKIDFCFFYFFACLSVGTADLKKLFCIGRSCWLQQSSRWRISAHIQSELLSLLALQLERTAAEQQAEKVISPAQIFAGPLRSHRQCKQRYSMQAIGAPTPSIHCYSDELAAAAVSPRSESELPPLTDRIRLRAAIDKLRECSLASSD